jgi:oxaloacetate decarboxylase (Na+ extruding) subunit gamma
MDGGLIDQGLELMLFGMGTVVTFLTLLVFATGLMSHIIARYFPVDVETDDSNVPTAPVDATLIAVISAAIHKHRSGR